MTTIYFIRHAEAEGNLYRRIHGWYDSLITENGYRQIAALEQRFAGIPIDAVYSSDLFRTRTTAAAVYKPKGLELHTTPALREIKLGAWEDVPFGEAAWRDGERLRLFNAASEAFSVPGGETFAQVQQRLLRAVREIAAAHDGQRVAIVTHGTGLRCLRGAMQGLKPGQLSQLSHSDNTAVTCVEVTDGQFHVVFENDNSHLSPDISTLARQHWWRKEGKATDANLWFRPLDMEREAERYLEARREAWVSIHGTEIPFDAEGFLNEAMDRWYVDRRAVECAMLGDEPAGMLELDTERCADEGVGYIPFVYMNPAHRRRGLGIQLIGEAVSIYRPKGRTALRLRCAPDNAVAQRFYARYGFQKIGAAPGARVPLDLLEKYIGYGT